MEAKDALEEWRPIPGYYGRYSVSSRGRVYSHFSDRYLRPGPQLSGHLTVSLGRGHTRGVHTFVLLAFTGPRPRDCDGCHVNGDPTDNRWENLIWDTRGENIRHMKWQGKPRKLSVNSVRGIRKMHAAGCTHREIADFFDVARSLVHRIVTGQDHADVS